jgi:hypothetical protein
MVTKSMIRASPSFRIYLLVLSGAVLFALGRLAAVLCAQSAGGGEIDAPLHK